MSKKQSNPLLPIGCKPFPPPPLPLYGSPYAPPPTLPPHSATNHELLKLVNMVRGLQNQVNRIERDIEQLKLKAGMFK